VETATTVPQTLKMRNSQKNKKYVRNMKMYKDSFGFGFICIVLEIRAKGH